MSLSKLYSDIVAKTALGYTNPEIQDITKAVEELLNRLVSGEMKIDLGYSLPYPDEPTFIPKFRCAYLQPCGSMAEKTALWKSARYQGKENNFIEFDYLVVLENMLIPGDKIEFVSIGSEDCPCCSGVIIGFERVDCELFAVGLLSYLCSKINTMCSCRVGSNVIGLENDSHGTRPCEQCTVVKDTGYLQIAKVADFNPEEIKDKVNCSIVLYWTSHTDSLMAPSIETLQLTEKIKRLLIRVDVLPAFKCPVCTSPGPDFGLWGPHEIHGNRDDDDDDGDYDDHDRFVIAKECYKCRTHNFMISYSMYELNAIQNVSEKHKQCYRIIKFLFGQFIYWTRIDMYSYHAKVAFLTHCQTCTDDGEDCTTCITEVFQCLVEAYTSKSLELPVFHMRERLKLEFCNSYVRNLCISSLLSIFSDINSLATNKDFNTQDNLYSVVNLIKRTCRALLDGKFDIEDIHGKFK